MLIEKVNIPDGEKGDFKVMKFKVDSTGSLQTLFSNPARVCPEGEYTKLVHAQRGVIMSDTPAEMRDHIEAVIKAKGSCLINGLGIGMVLKAVLNKPEVTDVTVIELEQDVIDLVAPHYVNDPRVTIIQADAYLWQPPKEKRYSMVWHDIWDNISEDNLPLMGKLHRKYGRKADWQGSWAKHICLSQRRRSSWW